MLIVVVAFSLCWAPWQSYSLTSIVYPAVNQWRYVNIMFFIFHWLAMSNSCYNPFIYGIYSVILYYYNYNIAKQIEMLNFPGKIQTRVSCSTVLL